MQKLVQMNDFHKTTLIQWVNKENVTQLKSYLFRICSIIDWNSTKKTYSWMCHTLMTTSGNCHYDYKELLNSHICVSTFR